MHTYGLIGHPLAHSFSPRYFAEKFARESITNAEYLAFELAQITDFPTLLTRIPTLRGLNVTIPYKEQVLPYLDQLSTEADAVGAVNTIAFEGDMLVGYNTDVIGFRESLLALLPEDYTGMQALILGTGGAAKAVAYVLGQLHIPYHYVSRTAQEGRLVYQQLNPSILEEYPLLINTSPVGQYPNIKECPNLPYAKIDSRHFLMDLIYNPSETLFLERGRTQGAQILNGLPMLEAQAEAAWRIWNRF